MNKDTKIIIGAIAILFVCLIVSDSSITGQAFFDRLRFWRRTPIETVPISESSTFQPVPGRGVPISPPSISKCTDSDSLNLAIRGKTCDGSNCVYDSCEGSTVIENYCLNGKKSAKYSCPIGYVCSNGACVKKEVEKQEVCVDTDGRNIYVKGNKDECVAYSWQYYKNKGYVWLKPQNDHCIAGDENILGKFPSGDAMAKVSSCHVWEYYCENNIEKKELVKCESGECVNGACVKGEEKICTDSDNGNNIYVKGTTKDELSTKTDMCKTQQYDVGTDKWNWWLDSWEKGSCKVGTILEEWPKKYVVTCSIREYVCENGVIKEILTICESGECINGACVK